MVNVAIYLEWLARNHPGHFASLYGRLRRASTRNARHRGAQVFGIGGGGEHGVGRGLEQQVVDHGLVLVGDVGDRCR
jgi:hypothetical protein